MAAGRGGVAGWSIHHPIGVVMITAAVLVLGALALGRLPVDLLPQITYPEIRVRILDPGVPAEVMEDRVTRQLEEQLAITEDAIAVQSRTTEGASAVDLSFTYGTDIARALQDASSRLDRAKRFLPDSIDPPIIFKFDPSQLPVAEFAVSSTRLNDIALRSWVDEIFAKWFVNLPGVAAAEVGGGLVREIRIQPDPARLAALGLTLDQLIEVIRRGNQDIPAGRLRLPDQEYTGRTTARVRDLAVLAALPVKLPNGGSVRLDDIATILDSHEDERLRTRLDGVPAIKLSIQKQPAANTVAVVDAVRERLAWLRANDQLPAHIKLTAVSDESLFVRQSLRNAASAAVLGALLAMLVIYLFLGDLRRTLIIGSAIPIGIMVTFGLMALGGLTLNIMTLGGLAVGVGMLVDNTIVMLENIQRHQRRGAAPIDAAQQAVGEVTSAVVASTTTNLAAVLPFLFVGGLVGLLFRELVFTLSAAIAASLLVAITLVPALAARVAIAAQAGGWRAGFDRGMTRLQDRYAGLLERLLKRPATRRLTVIAFVLALIAALGVFSGGSQIFLPDTDDGRVFFRISVDPGTVLDDMDRMVVDIERMIAAQPEVENQFTIVGGMIFGRTEREIANRSSISAQLKPLRERTVSTGEWVRRMEARIAALHLPGAEVRISSGGVRGLRIGRGDEAVSLRVQGPDLDTLIDIGNDLMRRLKDVPGLRNLVHSNSEVREELSVEIDRERAARVGVDPASIGRAVQVALDGMVVSDYISEDREYDIRLRLPPGSVDLQSLPSLVIGQSGAASQPVHLGDVADVKLIPSPTEILRDNQRRIVEISATLATGAALGEVNREIQARLAGMPMPPGYSVYDAGDIQALQAGRKLGGVLLGLALFLVFVVMAVQYESLRDPLVILLGVPFAAVGAAAGIALSGLPLSMPVWLGMIMLAGIVVNNAILLVEYVEQLRARGMAPVAALVEAGRLRLRPILMTSLTTIVSLLPLAAGIGEGAEMLQPLAVTLVAGLALSLLVTLILIPILHLALGPGRPAA